ncbi:hypothetical protein GCM10009836_46670 [Pseudonocardia ailaonensis]|uniref:Uncharacterized protein n=1 Tax=Pseudonocardia ailaonensis TaxID=367279 RepID=A0ABN2NBY7_9PSEU
MPGSATKIGTEKRRSEITGAIPASRLTNTPESLRTAASGAIGVVQMPPGAAKKSELIGEEA